MEERQKTVLEIFEKLQRGVAENPERAKKVGGVYQFRITGPQEGLFWVNLAENPEVRFEERKADCVIEARDRDFLKVYKGVIPGYKAVLSGKLKISGRLDMATRLGEVFSAFRSKKQQEQEG